MPIPPIRGNSSQQPPTNSNKINNSSLFNRIKAAFQRLVYKCAPESIAFRLLGQHTYSKLFHADSNAQRDKRTSERLAKAQATFAKRKPPSDLSTYGGNETGNPKKK